MPNVVSKLFKIIHSKIMWNSVLRYLIQTYLTFAVSTLLAIRFLPQGTLLNGIVCIAGLMYLLLFPVYTFLFLLHTKTKTDNKLHIDDQNNSVTTDP